jgi:hypothetical protein
MLAALIGSEGAHSFDAACNVVAGDFLCQVILSFGPQ